MPGSDSKVLLGFRSHFDQVKQFVIYLAIIDLPAVLLLHLLDLRSEQLRERMPFEAP